MTIPFEKRITQQVPILHSEPDFMGPELALCTCCQRNEFLPGEMLFLCPSCASGDDSLEERITRLELAFDQDVAQGRR